MNIISGKEVAGHISSKVKDRVEKLIKQGQRVPKLVIVRVGDRPDDLSYQRGAIKRMDMVGIAHKELWFEENVSKEAFYKKFDDGSLSVDSVFHQLFYRRCRTLYHLASRYLVCYVVGE